MSFASVMLGLVLHLGKNNWYSCDWFLVSLLCYKRA